VLTHRSSPGAPVSRVVRYVDSKLAAAFPDLAEMRAEFDRQAVRESMSVLYVALTRAVHSVHMIVAPMGDSLPATYASVLRAALAPGLAALPETVLFETPAEEIVASRRPAPAPRKVTLPAPVTLAKQPARRERNLVHLTPSRLAERETVKLADLLSNDRRISMRRGSLVHAWLESIEWIESGLPDDAALDRIAAALKIPTEDREAVREEFRAALDRPAVQATLSREVAKRAYGADSVLEVQREFPFAVRDGDAVLSGTFDRVHVVRRAGRIDTVEVIDFKTDAVLGNEAASARARVHAPQMEAYRRAAQRLFPGALVKPQMLFLRAGVAVSI
jgi:ATP-dependent exoDNAse (exonuclease V) beta subunit